MTEKGINLKKVEKMACLALQNGIRLHEDSMLMFHNKRFPSAYFLSILAIEEIGKYFILEGFYSHSRIDGRVGVKFEKDWLRMIYMHQVKQGNFEHILNGDSKSRYFKEYEKNKQNAVYVGLSRYKGKINLKGKIINPLNVTMLKAKKQITYLNDRIIEFVFGLNNYRYCVDCDDAERILSKKLFNRLRLLWPTISCKTKNRIRKMENGSKRGWVGLI